jgi:hypothetical protein
MTVKLNERIIPEAALRDPKSVEMLRVWVAEQGLHCSLKIGSYEQSGISEEKAWGLILADVARHLANAISETAANDKNEILTKIIENLLAELDRPTSQARGKFIQRH